MHPFRRPYFYLLLVTLYLLAASTLPCQATTLSGTVKWQGLPFNGYLDVALVYPGTTGTYLVLPGRNPQGHLPITNGNLPPMTVEGNDTLLPRGTYYQFTYYDAYSNALARLNYVITGDSFDVGAAVPTPITPANISYLDLLGLRNLSTTNLNVVNSITINQKAVFSQTGIANAQSLDDILFAYAFATGSTTCGIQEALNALPATGGTVYLQRGSCTAISPITISKPVVLTGHGSGSSIIINGSGVNTLFTVKPVSPATSLAGVTFSNFNILGNSTVPGATGGDCILVLGSGSTSVSAVSLTDMVVGGCFQNGLHASNAVRHLTITRSFFTASLGSGILLDTPVGGSSLTSTALSRVRLEGNTVDGLTVSGTGVGLVSIDSSSLSSNLQNGLRVVSGSVLATVNLQTSTLTDNHNAGVLLADGFAHSVSDSSFLPGTHQQYGVYLSNPALADLNTVQATLRNNNLQRNLTFDIYEAATVSNLLLYPQVEGQASSTVHYSLLGITTTFGATKGSFAVGADSGQAANSVVRATSVLPFSILPGQTVSCNPSVYTGSIVITCSMEGPTFSADIINPTQTTQAHSGFTLYYSIQ